MDLAPNLETHAIKLRGQMRVEKLYALIFGVLFAVSSLFSLFWIVPLDDPNPSTIFVGNFFIAALLVACYSHAQRSRALKDTLELLEIMGQEMIKHVSSE